MVPQWYFFCIFYTKIQRRFFRGQPIRWTCLIRWNCLSSDKLPFSESAKRLFYSQQLFLNIQSRRTCQFPFTPKTWDTNLSNMCSVLFVRRLKNSDILQITLNRKRILEKLLFLYFSHIFQPLGRRFVILIISMVQFL